MVPRLLWQDEGDSLAGDRIAIPIRKLEVVEAADEARAIVDARPRCFADAVVGSPPPATNVVCIVDLDFTNGGVGSWQGCGNIAGTVPAVMEPPFLLCACAFETARDWGDILWGLALSERSNIVVRESAIVDAHLVEVSAAVIAVCALNACWTDDAGMGPELIQPCIEHACRSLFSNHLAIDVETDASRLVPGEREIYPLVRLGKTGHVIRDACTAQVHVRDEGIETMAVVIDAQPHLVPTGVISVANAKDWEQIGRASC